MSSIYIMQASFTAILALIPSKMMIKMFGILWRGFFSNALMSSLDIDGHNLSYASAN